MVLVQCLRALKMGAMKIMAFAIGLLFFLVVNSCNKSTNPPPAEFRGWNFVLQDQCCSHRSFVFNTNERTVVDSFLVLDESFHPELSSDGQTLFVPSDSVYLYDIKSHTQIRSLPYSGILNIATSSDNLHSAFVHRDSGLIVLKSPTYAERFRFREKGLWGAEFSADGSELYFWAISRIWRAVVGDSITIIDSMQVADGLHFVVKGDPINGYLYTHAQSNQNRDGSMFVVYDMSTWTRVYSHLLSNGGGLAMSPNGERAYFTNVFDASGGIGDQFLRIYSRQAQQVIDSIDVGKVMPHAAASLGPLELTPDGKYLVTVGSVAGGKISLFDLETLSFDTMVNVGDTNHMVISVTGQK